MGKFRDLTGETFGKWTATAIDWEKYYETGKYHYICKCECGTIRSVYAGELTSGRSTSCGCTKFGPKEDIIGKTFGVLKVDSINEEVTRNKGEFYYNCTCECSNKTVVSGRELRRGRSKSCGCKRAEYFSTSRSRSNEYIVYDELGYALGFFNSSDEYFVIDAEDLDVAKSRCWFKNNRGYAMSRIRYKSTNPERLLHRAILFKHYGEYINDKDTDHKNHDILNDRKENLRLCTRGENGYNKIARPSNTGERYISYIERDNLYAVNVPEPKQFKKYEDAIAYRDNYFVQHPEIDEYRYKPEEDVRFNPFIYNIMTPYTYVNPKNLPIIDPFYYYPSIPEKPLINPFVIVDTDKFYNR